ncbi:MAG: carboxypeptidase-like regulatory domain-containing protein [Hymenobacter sp.]|nr:MAG: carboxypeptidase-like regulatory domain-containing protein [Hymenobacter sp.]
MPQPLTSLRIPQPCPESWAAMTPNGLGRHCAACQKTVVDFTTKTDAEILAYLAHATGETCGRFGDDQLDRPLRPVGLRDRSTGRWRAWLALALAAWGLRASPAAASAPSATPPSAAHPRKKPGLRPHSARPVAQRLRGTVRDAATHEPLAGVAVFLKGENRSATTDSAGRFSLRLPLVRRAKRALVLHYTGYESATVRLPAATGPALAIELQPDPAAAGVTIVGYGSYTRRDITGGAVVQLVADYPPKTAAERPHSFWRWLTRPFRR